MINAISSKIASTNVIKTGNSNNYASSNMVAFKGAAGVAEEAVGKIAKEAKFVKTKALFNKILTKTKEFVKSMFNKLPEKVQSKIKSIKSFVSEKFTKIAKKAKTFVADFKAKAAEKKARSAEAKAAKKAEKAEKAAAKAAAKNAGSSVNESSDFAGSPSVESVTKKSPRVLEIKEKIIYDKETGKIPVQIKKTQGGRTIEKIDVDPLGKPLLKTEFENGRKVSESSYKNGTLFRTDFFNVKGRKTDSLRYSSLGDVLDKEVFMDNGERLVTKFTIDGSKIVAKLHYGADGSLLSNTRANTLLIP